MDNYQIIHFNHPLEIKKLSFLDIGQSKNPIDEENSKKKFLENYKSTIKPKLETVIKIANEGKSTLVYFSLPFLHFLDEHAPNMILEIKKCVEKGKIQLIGSCAYHSFSYLCSPILFQKEAEIYLQGIQSFFSEKPGIFINTACLYDDQIAEIVHQIGYQGIIATANPWHLAGKHSGQVYKSNTTQPFNILLSNGDSPDNFQISLVNGYGSAYSSDSIDKEIVNQKQIQELFMLGNTDEHSVYAVSLPLSSPTWEHKIPDYTNNPLQKALLKQASDLVSSFQDKLSNDDFKLLMLLCQPNHLLQINQTTKEEGYDHFISSMNWLTDISLRCKK
jgi:alpha-amylase